MNDLVDEWIQKAEGDYESAMREHRARKSPNFDAAGFRYPGQSAGHQQAKRAITIMTKLRLLIKAALTW